MTIGSVDGFRVEEAKARILSIIDPPKADVGGVYMGKVVNITKFGAFVNILPGRDGLVHISKLGRGKRINAVEDVLSLGDEIEVRVDEIDDKGKVSLSPVGDGSEGDAQQGGSDEPRAERGPRPEPRHRDEDRGPRPERSATMSDAVVVSFEDAFDEELRSELGDLGPVSEPVQADRPPRGDSDRGRGSRDRGPRRHR